MAPGTAAGRGHGARAAGRVLALCGLLLGSVLDARPPEFSHCLFVSLGEAPYWQASDMAGSAIVPQVGYSLELTMNRAVFPYVEASLGRYNHGMMPGVLAGVQAGWTFAHVRPRLFGALGFQSAKDRDFGGLEGEELSVERRNYFPLEFGAKVEWLGAFYTGLDARYAGYPMWSFELGYRLGGLSGLMQPFGPTGG